MTSLKQRFSVLKQQTELAPKFILVVFALCLQIHINILQSEHYAGLLFNIGDVFLPFIGVFILASLFTTRSQWPQWQAPFGYWAPIALSLCIILASVNGIYAITKTPYADAVKNAVIQWTVLNKGIGWCVTMAYFMLGAWLSYNYAHHIRRFFMQPFLMFLCLIITLEIFILILISSGVIDRFDVYGSDRYLQLQGFMGNRNALSFMYCCALSVTAALMLSPLKLTKLETLSTKFLWAILPAFIFLNGSRAMLLILAPIVIYFAIKNFRVFIRVVIPMLLIGGVFIATFLALNGGILNAYLGRMPSKDALHQHNQKIISSDRARLDTIHNAWNLYTETPVTGSGIGALRGYNLTSGNDQVLVLDNSLIWIFTEMGPFSLLCFMMAYIAMIVSLRRKMKRDNMSDNMSDEEQFAQNLSHAGIMILLCFGGFSCFHEILNARFFWFILGACLAYRVSIPISSAAVIGLNPQKNDAGV